MDTMNVNQAISQQIFQVLTKASLDNLNAGDIISGRIQSLENGLLLIKLLDGALFTAKTPDGFAAKVGEPITLEIGDRQNNQLTAKIINQRPINNGKAGEETVLIDTIKSNLGSLGVENSQSLISGVLDLIKAEPGIPTEKASFIIANGFKQDPEMIEIFQKISEHEFSLHKNLESLEEGLSDSLFKTDADTSLRLLKPLLVSQEADELSGILDKLFSEASPKLVHTISQNVRELLTKVLINEFSDTESLQKADTMSKEAVESLMKNALSIVENESSKVETAKSESILTPQNTEGLLKTINKAIESIHTKTEAFMEGNNNPDFQKQIKAVLEKLFDKASIKVENNITEKLDIKEKNAALKEIMDFSQKVLNNLDDSAKASNMPAFKEINNAFKFFSQVNTYDSILQLPIMINRENTTGELYVMKRKKGRKNIDTENFTLFLSLTTNSLGIVESFLNASRKCITISFRVEDENLVKLVKENYRVLYDGLLEKGFKLVEMKCRVLEKERVNPVNAVEKAQELLGTQNKVDLKL